MSASSHDRSVLATDAPAAKPPSLSPLSQRSLPLATAVGHAEEGDGQQQEDGKTLQLNQRVESSSEAIRLGRSGLRQANKNRDKGTIEIMGHPGLVAGIVIALTGFGKHDGSYFVEKAEHAVSSSGYRTSAEIRRTLSY